MKFETARCLIREFEEKDIDGFMRYRNDMVWMKYQTFKGLPKPDYEKALLRPISLEKGAQLAVVLKGCEQLIGDLYVKKEADAFWVGYTVSPVYAGKGYACEAVSGLIAWIKEQSSGKILASAEPGNIPSIHLLKKLNFVFTGTDADGEQLYAFKP